MKGKIERTKMEENNLERKGKKEKQESEKKKKASTGITVEVRI